MQRRRPFERIQVILIEGFFCDLGSLHGGSLLLASLADLPVFELENDLLNFRWLETLPNDQVLAVLTEIYANPPAPQADFIREVTLQEISKRDAPKAQELFTSRVLRLDEPFDLFRIRYMKLPPSRELDRELIRILEDRWTERMSRVAPIIGLYATDSILPRVKKVYEVWGPSWPCSIEAGLLTYFLRVDPGYGTEKLGPALAAYNDMGTSDCRVSLLVDMALLRNPPELKPFVSAALNDSRPLVAAAGAQVTGFEVEDKVRMGNLVRRLRLLHEEWTGFDEKSKSDTDYMHRWQSGYDELERMITIDLVNANDSRENTAVWRSALDVCVTEFCRKEMKSRLARSSF